MPVRRVIALWAILARSGRSADGRGIAARAHRKCGPRVGPVRAVVPCNALRTRTDMANNPKRIQDPTEAAMSAIQEALNLREDPPARKPEPDLTATSDPFAPPIAPVQPAPAREGRRRPSRSAPPIDEDLFLAETVGRAQAPAPAPADLDEVKPAQRAANDDRQSVGQLLQ